MTTSFDSPLELQQIVVDAAELRPMATPGHPFTPFCCFAGG